MRRLAAIFLLLSLAGPVSAAKIPDSAWQDGTLREIKQTTRSGVVGVLNDGHGYIGDRLSAVMHYFIEAPGYTYQANWPLKGRHPRQLLVTVHGPIKFALVGHDFYIKDDEGKTQRLVFVERELRQ